ncbi:hypothetical protein BsWGS_06105 [Bradybaena similaris]
MTFWRRIEAILSLWTVIQTLRLHGGGRVKVTGEVSFLAWGLLQKRSSLLTQARNDTVIYFLEENFATVHNLYSTGKDPMNACCHPDSRASLYVTICFQFAQNEYYHLTCLGRIDLTTNMRMDKK